MNGRETCDHRETSFAVKRHKTPDINQCYAVEFHTVHPVNTTEERGRRSANIY